jgi:crotonobetainyl-CoA:carnitine CoA-transferase CaiB-like acyl-CoA transferase
MIDEGKAEDLADEGYQSFIAELNLRFLTTLFQDTATIGQRLARLRRINEVLQRFIKSKGKWEMYEGGQGRRLLFGIVATPQDIANNPQLKHRKWLTGVEHPELGQTLQYPGPPYRLSRTPWAIRRRPPLPGEHNDEVFRGELGLTADELDALRAAGAM